MATVYFISDAHLGLGSKTEERDKEYRLLSFLDHISTRADQLFIVGDLFDAWFEYRTVIPKGFHRILTKLEDLIQQGVEIHYLAGNHDYWMGSFFRDDLGMKVYHHAFSATVHDKKIFFHHGDGLSDKDSGYRVLKRILRSKITVWLYTWVHPDLGLALAKYSSQKSRNYTSSKHYGDEDGMLRAARRKVEEGFDIVIMGHRHRPIRQEIGNGIYINLGDWITHDSYAEMVDGCIELRVWKIPNA